MNINDLYSYNCGIKKIEKHKAINDKIVNMAFNDNKSEKTLETFCGLPFTLAISLTPNTLIPNIEKSTK